MGSNPDHRSTFPPTRWTLIAEAAGPDAAAARAALEKLCAAVWYPLYAYVRRRGHGPEDAEDLVQGFFVRLIGRDWFAAARRERGRLRSFLIHQMNCHLADEARHRSAAKRGGGQAAIPLDTAEAEARYAAEQSTGETPETLYHRRWALTLLEQALSTLETGCAARGEGVSFALLRPALTEPTATALDTAAVAETLGIPRDQVKVRVHRLRTRFRETLHALIAETLHTDRAADVEEELAALLAALRPPGQGHE